MEIIKEKVPKATLTDFHNCGQFPQASPSEGSFFLLLFLSCENPEVDTKVFLRQDRLQTTIAGRGDPKHGRIFVGAFYTDSDFRVASRIRSSHSTVNWFSASLQLTTPPECHAASVRLRRAILPSPDFRGLGLRSLFFVEATTGFTFVTAR